MLTGALTHFQRAQEESASPEMVVTQAQAIQECDQNALDFGEFRVGCRHETRDVRVRQHSQPAKLTLGQSSGGAKFVSSNSN